MLGLTKLVKSATLVLTKFGRAQQEITMHKMHKYFIAIAVIAGALLGISPAQAASFTAEQVAAHPCLDKTSLPWRISPVKTADVPEAYKGWSGVWAGFWGGRLCHVMVIKKIDGNGVVDFIYGTGQPYYEHGEFVGVVTKDGDGQKLEATLGNGNRVKYTLIPISGERPSYLLEGLYKNTTSGQFKPVKTE